MMYAQVLPVGYVWVVRTYDEAGERLYDMPCRTEREAELLLNAWKELDDGKVHDACRRRIWPGSPRPPRHP